MRASKHSPNNFTFENRDLDVLSYAPRCSMSNRPSASNITKPRIMFSAGSDKQGRRGNHERARRVRTAGVTRPAVPATMNGTQGETSARSQFELLVSSRAAHHDAVQAALQPVETKPNLKVTQGRARSASPMAARIPSPLSVLSTTPAADILLGIETPELPRSLVATGSGPVYKAPEGPVCYRILGPNYYKGAIGDGPRFRSEAVALEVTLQEQLHKLDLEFPPSADKHRQQQRLQLAREKMHTLCSNPALASNGILMFLQMEYESAIAATAHDAQQCTSATASLNKANWMNSSLKQQVQKLQGRLADSDGLTARLKRDLLLVKAKAEALEFSVSEKDAEIELLHDRQDRQDSQMIQLMNEKEVLLGVQVTPRSAQEKPPPPLPPGLPVPTSTGHIKARIAKEQTLTCDEIRDMDDDTFLASLHSNS